MGVAGLTTFIYHRENLYFDEVFLKNCALIIDGNSLVPYLYNSSLIHASAFGGDYDKVGQLTERFFKRLAFNDVFPIVIFDGAVEKRKVNTLKTRSRNKLISLQNVTPLNSNSQCFPLLMRKAMREKLIDMEVVILQTDLEADSEIAALSKIYQVPVLSNDSDFFIFDVLYIPIPTLNYSDGTNSPIKCKIFRMDKFLRHLDINVELLPLLAVVLGNDYIPRSEFRQFLGQIKMDKRRHAVGSSRVVGGVLKWLKSESAETALHKVLSCMRSRGREVLRQKILKIMRGYTNLTTVLTHYIPDTSKMKGLDLCSLEPLDDTFSRLGMETEKESDVESDNDDDDPQFESLKNDESSFDDVNYCSSEEVDDKCASVKAADVEAILSGQQGANSFLPVDVFPKWLMDSSRMGRVSPDILTLLNLKAYFSTPQPECYSMTFSGEPYLRVLQCISGLVLGPTEIRCWYRQHRNKYEETTITTIARAEVCGEFPKIALMDKISIDQRRALLHEIMEVDKENLAGIPDSWKLYIVSVSYWLRHDENNELKPHHLHSVILMMLTLLVVDSKIGYHRQRKTFVKKYGVAVGKIAKTREKTKLENCPVFDSISSALENVTKDDCVLIFDILLQNFQVDRQIRCSKQFSTTLVHSFARLQHCLNFTSMLNTVLAFPYPDVKINAFYNGTFLYNTAVRFKKKSNIISCIDSFLAKVPSLLGLYKVIYKTLQKMCPELQEVKPKKRSRKPKSSHSSELLKESAKFDSDSEPFFDRNNRFCVVFS